MLLTKENDYAIRIARSLRDGEKHTVKEICLDEEVPEAFAYKIIRKLQKAHILEVLRGANGGCRLKGNLNNLTLYDLLAAVDEEAPLIMPCLKESCNRNEGGNTCKVHGEMVRIQAVLLKELKNSPLSELF